MSSKEIKVTFETLTPLWTGDAWRKCDQLKLTGILGSLRWWFEALVRGMGYKACDSTGDKCQVEIKNPEDVLNIQEKICPVCYLFGTTGWKSRFSVSVENNNLLKSYNGKVLVRINRGKNWYYESGLMGDVGLKFNYDENIILGVLKEQNEDEKILTLKDLFPSILKILLYLVSEHGMLGAKTSMGYGVVKIQIEDNDISISEDDWNKFENYLKLFNKKFKGNINWLPNLRDFFFVKFNVTGSIDNVINNVKGFFRYQDGIIETNVIDKWKDKNWCITSPIVRKCLRCIFRGQYSKGVCWNNRSCTRNYWWNYDKNNNTKNTKNRAYNSDLTIDKFVTIEKDVQNIRHFLMGSTSEPEFSAIQVSHVYKNKQNKLEFRIYGWLPEINSINSKVNDIIELLTKLFKNTSSWNSKLPSTIQNNICWDNSGLKKINSNIKALFVKNDNQGDYQ